MELFIITFLVVFVVLLYFRVTRDPMWKALKNRK